jgi:Zn-dependent M28 family amino/carboxypeptidase
MLPALYHTLAHEPRHFTFILVGFAGEEAGPPGAKSFVKRRGKTGGMNTRAMINIDSVGLTPSKVWVNRADARLVAAIFRVAASLNLPLSGMNSGQVGDSDSRPIKEKKIPVLDVHSVTSTTLPILHSPMDTLAAIDRQH